MRKESTRTPVPGTTIRASSFIEVVPWTARRILLGDVAPRHSTSQVLMNKEMVSSGPQWPIRSEVSGTRHLAYQNASAAQGKSPAVGVACSSHLPQIRRSRTKSTEKSDRKPSCAQRWYDPGNHGSSGKIRNPARLKHQNDSTNVIAAQANSWMMSRTPLGPRCLRCLELVS